MGEMHSVADQGYSKEIGTQSGKNNQQARKEEEIRKQKMMSKQTRVKYSRQIQNSNPNSTKLAAMNWHETLSTIKEGQEILTNMNKSLTALDSRSM